MTDKPNQNQPLGAAKTAAPGSSRDSLRPADKALKAATIFWFVVAVGGQAIFAVYIAIFYGGTTLNGNVNAWNEVVPGRVVAGDMVGLASMAAHVILAFIVTVAGPLQLIPALRARLPKLHRWTGRIYIVAAFAISMGGLYLVWGVREADDTILGSVPLTLNALLIMAFAAMALKTAVGRRIDLHRQWALRLFLAMSGVWCLRVGIMVWILTIGTDGLGERLEGPVGTFLKFACYAFPLLILEFYFATRRTRSATWRWAMTALLTLVTIGMGVGIGMASMVFWLPHL